MGANTKATEHMLSEMARVAEEAEAEKRGVPVSVLRAMRRECRHTWENKGYYDECTKCGEGRA